MDDDDDDPRRSESSVVCERLVVAFIALGVLYAAAVAITFPITYTALNVTRAYQAEGAPARLHGASIPGTTTPVRPLPRPPSPPPQTNDSSTAVDPPGQYALKTTWISPRPLVPLAQRPDCTVGGDLGGRLFAGADIDPQALRSAKTGTLLIVHGQGSWWAGQHVVGYSTLWLTRVPVLPTGHDLPVAMALPVTSCGGMGGTADRALEARLAESSTMIVLVTRILRFPDPAFGSVASDTILALYSTDDGLTWLPAQETIGDSESLESLVSDTVGNGFTLVTRSAQGLLVRALSGVSLQASGPHLAVPDPKAVCCERHGGGATLVPSTSVAQARTTRYVAWPEADHLVLSLLGMANISRRVPFDPNPYIQRHGQGTYVTHETSAFDLAHQPSKDLGVWSTMPHAMSPVNQTAMLRRSLGLPRIAHGTGLLAVVGPSMAGPRAVAVRYATCNANVDETCRPRTEPDPICVPDELTYTWSACRWAKAPLDAATLVVSSNDGLTWSVPLVVDASGDQTVALGIAVHSQAKSIAVLYERLRGDARGTCTTRLAIFSYSGTNVQWVSTVTLHVYGLRRQAYRDGSWHADSVSLVPYGATGWLVAWARVPPLGIDACPDAAVDNEPAIGQVVVLDTWERSRLALALVDL